MKIVVFGASVGRHFVEQAVEAGHAVKAVYRSNKSLPGNLQAQEKPTSTMLTH
jgi:putative NADH-flavin reductase